MTLDDLHAVLLEIRDELRGLREDQRRNSGLPDVKIGKGSPKDWRGPSYEGRCASECPADFLLEYAALLEWKASKQAEEGKEFYAKTAVRDATLCRKWAAVNRAVEPAPQTQDSRRAPAESGAEQKRGWSSGGTTWGQRKAQ